MLLNVVLRLEEHREGPAALILAVFLAVREVRSRSGQNGLLLGHLQDARLDLRAPSWFVEGMAYGLGEDPRALLAHPPASE